MMRRWIVMLAIGLLVLGAIPALAQQGQVTYTVRGGDTLAAIAARYDVSLNQLLVANGLTDPNTIFAGQVLVIPTTANFGTGGPLPGPQPNVIVVTPPPPPPIPTQPVTPPPVVTPPPTPAPQLTYTVQPGDSLTRIASLYGVSVQDLAAANGISNINIIPAGRVLVLPVGAVLQQNPGAGGGGTGGPLLQYVVEAGDVLELIAEEFDTTVEVIVELNDLENPGRLFPGDVLLIP
jgi:LysM repeat protein